MLIPRETYPVGRRHWVEFSFDGLRLEAAWSPDVPPAKIRLKLLPAYRKAREAFLARLVPAYGTIAVVEL